jgi:hypothetical protein
MGAIVDFSVAVLGLDLEQHAFESIWMMREAARTARLTGVAAR